MLTKNEESTIQDVILKINSWLQSNSEINSSLAIVDDSVDRTCERASSQGVQVVKGQGRGLGHSYLLGLNWALKQNPEYILTLDGDGQVDLVELSIFWKTAVEENMDLVLASRFLEKNKIGYIYPSCNRYGVAMLTWFMNFTSGVNITDSHGGIRLYSARAAKAIRLRGLHTYVQESILSIASSKFKIKEISSAWKPRSQGQSRVVRSRTKYMVKMFFPLMLTGIGCVYRRMTA